MYGSEGEEGEKRRYPRGYREMRDDKTPNPAESDDFNEALAELVHEAFLNEVDVEGAWDIYGRKGSGMPEFSVEIYRLDV